MTSLKEFADSAMDDRECFAKTLSRIETDLDAMRARGNAWAVGDIATLRTLPQGDQYRTCLDALAATGVAKRLDIADLRQRVAANWLAVAQDAIARNNSTFASLPVADLLESGGFSPEQSGGLEALGYALRPVPDLASAPVIARDADTREWTAAADPRRGGAALGE